MANKILIGVSAQGAIVADWRGRRIADCRAFAHDEAGLAGYRDYLAGFGHVPVQMMVDAVEEDYRFETLPHVAGSDRADMVNRKLKQHYRNTPYMASALLGRETEKRRDDRYLFSALTNPELIADWLQPVAAQDLPVAGIYLLPMVSAELVEKLGPRASNLLLVAQHPNGLRLTFFRERRFRLSRLTRGDGGRAENRVRYFSEEISNTRLYLHALRTMTLDEQLTVLLVDRTDELGEVATGIARESPSLDCVHFGRRELASRVGISESLLDLSPYTMYLHLLGLQAPRSNLAPAGVTAGYRRYQMRHHLYVGCGALAAGALMWTGVNFYQAMQLRWETEDAARQTATYAAQYQEITRQFPQAPASAENLRKTVEIAQKLRESLRNPQRMMTLVSRAVEANPTIVLREFAWKYGSTEIEADPAARAAVTGPAPAPAGAAPGAPGAAPLLRRESALIDGEIRPFRGDYRSAIVTINSLASRLGAAPEVAEVRVIKLPLNVNPTLSLAGSTLDNPQETAAATAEFRLLVLLKPDQ
jgi:hypothetical protein